VPLTVDDQLAIQTLYADYCFAVDDGDGPGFAACFTSEGVLDPGYGEPIRGTEAFTAFALPSSPICPDCARVTNVSVDGSGDDARAAPTVRLSGDRRRHKVWSTGDTVTRSDE